MLTYSVEMMGIARQRRVRLWRKPMIFPVEMMGIEPMSKTVRWE